MEPTEEDKEKSELKNVREPKIEKMPFTITMAREELKIFILSSIDTEAKTTSQTEDDDDKEEDISVD